MIRLLIKKFVEYLNGGNDRDSGYEIFEFYIAYILVWGFPLLCAISGAFTEAKGEDRFVGVFAEQFVAEFLFTIGRPFSWFSIMIGVLVGHTFWTCFKFKILSFIIGIAAILALWTGTSFLAHSLRGVDTRYDIIAAEDEEIAEIYDPSDGYF